MSIILALVGDYNEKVVAHNAIPRALELASAALKINIHYSWVESTSIDTVTDLKKFHGIWAVPGSPYRNMEGVLTAIQFARETNRPFLGTCGGFQHALIEYARNVCGIVQADHSESNPDAETLIITPLSCSLVGKSGDISFISGSQLDSIFKGKGTTEAYHCNYGLNTEWKSHLEKAGINFTGFDTENQVRAFELPAHPFFIGTLFQPERSALKGQSHPLITTFIQKMYEM